MSLVRPATQENIADARSVILSRFSKSALDVLAYVSSNPLLKECSEFGDIVYDDGKPVCFRASMLRTLYMGKRRILGRVRGLTCIREDAKPECAIDMQLAENSNWRGSVIAFSNTQCEATEKMAKIMRYKQGPSSCRRSLWCVVHPLLCAIYYFKRKVLKWPVDKLERDAKIAYSTYIKRQSGYTISRIASFDDGFFDSFFEVYLSKNEGLVSSRSREELSWIFGGRIKKGELICLIAEKSETNRGFIIIGGSPLGRWSILDWCAVGNNVDCLGCLLQAAKTFLREKTFALTFETMGFQDFVQPLLKKVFNRETELGYCQHSYNCRDKMLADECESVINTDKSWFFGPYDGDACLG